MKKIKVNQEMILKSNKGDIKLEETDLIGINEDIYNGEEYGDDFSSEEKVNYSKLVSFLKDNKFYSVKVNDFRGLTTLSLEYMVKLRKITGQFIQLIVGNKITNSFFINKRCIKEVYVNEPAGEARIKLFNKDMIYLYQI